MQFSADRHAEQSCCAKIYGSSVAATAVLQYGVVLVHYWYFATHVAIGSVSNPTFWFVLILQGGCILTQFQFGIAIFSTDLMVLSSDPHEWYGCDPKVAATVVQILHKCNFDCTLTATPRASPYM